MLVMAKADREPQPWHARLRLAPLADWITTGEAAEDLGISREAVHRLVQRGTLKARTIGRRPVIVVSRRAVQALPVSPQRRRELDKDSAAGDTAADTATDTAAEFGDELPEG